MIHVHPLFDLLDHNFTSEKCHCEPRIVMENDEIIVVHSSYDGREGVEMMKEVLADKVIISVDKSRGWEVKFD